MLNLGIFAFFELGFVELNQLKLQVVVFGGIFGRHLLQLVQLPLEGVIVTIFCLILR